MAVPKKRKTKSKTRSNRSHHAHGKSLFAKCGKCKAPVRPHEACRECGYYPKKKKAPSAKPETAKKKATSKPAK